MVVKKITKKVKHDNEQEARRAVLEDLFYDFHRSRAQVYTMNLVRGIFFGVGTVIGGTLVVAAVVWFLSLFADVPGALGDFVQYIVDTVQQTK